MRDAQRRSARPLLRQGSMHILAFGVSGARIFMLGLVLASSLVYGRRVHADGVPYVVKAFGDPNAFPSDLTASGSLLFFVAADGDHPELWRSDGRPAGTMMLGPGPGMLLPDHLTDLNGTLLFSGGLLDRELWRSDGTSHGTVLLENLSSSASSDPEQLTAIENAVFFSADDGQHGREPWTTDGTPGGTRLLRDVAVGLDDSDPTEFVGSRSDRVFFAASPSASGYFLWRSDGASDTSQVAVPYAGAPLPSLLTPGPELLFFAIETGQICWAGSGPAQCAAQSHGTPASMVVSGGVAISAYSGALYRTDAGTATTSKIANGGGEILAFRDAVYFVGEDATHGVELWRIDGSTSGASMVADLRLGPDGSYPSQLVVAGDTLYFVARDQNGDERIARTDGTASGTRFLPGVPEPDGFIAWLTSVGSTLYFVTYAETGDTPHRLWAVPPCGNGTVEQGEQCDDGNQLDGDCCSSSCTDPLPAGAYCDDFDACTYSGRCNAEGRCVDAFANPCADGDGCTVDSCEPAVGCRNLPVDRAAVEEALHRSLVSDDCSRLPKAVRVAFERARRRVAAATDEASIEREFRRAATILQRAIRKLNRRRSTACRLHFRDMLVDANTRLGCFAGFSGTTAPAAAR